MSLKVLWISPTIGKRFGGPSSTVTNGLIAENRGGMDSDLVTTIGPGEEIKDGDPARRLLDAGVDVRFFKRVGPAYRGEAWGLSPSLAFWLARNIRKYDVVHLQYVWCITSILGAMFGRVAGVPVVVTPHESLTDFDIKVASRHPLLRMMKRVLRHFYLALSDQFILMSKLEEDDTRSGDVPVRIISHAVLEHRVAEEVPRSDPGSGLKIAFLGRNIEKKGIHHIIQAVARKPDGSRKLKIAGPPGTSAFRSEMDRLILDLGVGEWVEWVGYVEDRATYLRAADVLAMPSVYEGFGMVSAEAMCVGVPVVVPAKSGVAEIVSECEAGIVMDESSAENLDRAFSELEESPSVRRNLGLHGLWAANSRLTFDVFARNTQRVYEELLHKSA